MSNEAIILTVYSAGCVICWLVLYVMYHLVEECDKNSNGFSLLAGATLIWPVGVIMALPVFMFIMIGDIIITQIKRRRKQEAHHE